MSKDDKSTSFSRCLGKINELSRYVHYHTDRSGRPLPARRGKSEGNTPLLCISHLSYVWYVLVLYTNTSWSSVCHKYFLIQISARTCSISVILYSHFSEIGLEGSRKIQELKAHFNYVCSQDARAALTLIEGQEWLYKFTVVWLLPEHITLNLGFHLFKKRKKTWPVMHAFPRQWIQLLRVLYTCFFLCVSENEIWCLERFEDL